MIPELGHFALIIALSLAVIQTIMPLWGSFSQSPNLVAIARPAAYGQFIFLIISFAILTYCFIIHDFSVSYVAQNSNSALPLSYRISAVWGAHEGSLLLWILILAGWTAAVARFSHSLPQILAARVIAVMGFISIGFSGFILKTSNPFERLPIIPIDGQDLNPLLQDPGLIIHPPMLYMGYVGFSVAFSFAIAALLGGQLDNTWARWSRPWTLIAWAFLTVGITLGSWWAYYELGWGGWWFWDPVENASFMPWLVGTALLHSLTVTEKRSAFKSWTVLLAIFAFSLSLLGTFLVRSGVLTSVHAFASDPERGVYILAFLVVVIGGSLTLYAWRAPQVKSSGKFQLFSRESILLLGNILLVVTAASVLFGTLYPLFMDALKLGKVSVGPPYFAMVFVPLMVPAVIAMGIAPFMRWKQNTVWQVFKQLIWIIIICLLVVGGITWYKGELHHWSLGLGLALWVILANLYYLKLRLKAEHTLHKLSQLPRSLVGMVLAHIGIGILIIGVTLSGAFSVEKNLRMAVGDSYEIAGYQYRFEGASEIQGANYTASEGHIRILKNNFEEVAFLRPQNRIYNVRKMPMTEAAINGNWLRDIYVALDEPLAGDAWAVRLYYKPFIRWIWWGAIFMAFGGLLAATDRRYRLGSIK